MIKKIILVIFISSLSIVFILVLFVETSISTVLTEERQKELITTINHSPELPPIFYNTYRKYLPETLNNNIYQSLFNHFVLQKRNRSYSNTIVNNWFFRTRRLAGRKYKVTDHIIISRFIERNCSQKKCFDYVMLSSDLGAPKRGVSSASEFFFKKELKDITEEEVLKFHFMLKASHLFSPRHNPERLKRAVEKLKK